MVNVLLQAFAEGASCLLQCNRCIRRQEHGTFSLL